MFRYKSNSRESQDLFILKVLDKKPNGTYLEIGANAPIQDNNTFLLENEFGWRGISLEWDINMSNVFNIVRKNPCVAIDATQVDYNDLLQFCNLPKHIDFLQLDIDPCDNTLKALKQIDFKTYSFSVITYEHDLYNGGDKEREESRQILESHGYTRVISDVMHNDLIFEDWYINQKAMTNDNWKLFVGEKVPMNAENLSQRYIDLFNTL